MVNSPHTHTHTQAAISMLKQEYKETPTLQEALQLAIKVLTKTLDSTKLNSEKGKLISAKAIATLAHTHTTHTQTHTHTHTHTVEIATLTREGEGEGARTLIKVLPANLVDGLIKEYNEKEEARKREEKAKEERAKEERAKAEKAAAAKTS